MMMLKIENEKGKIAKNTLLKSNIKAKGHLNKVMI